MAFVCQFEILNLQILLVGLRTSPPSVMSSSKKCFVLRFRDRDVLVLHDQCPHYSVSLTCKYGAITGIISDRRHCRTSLHSHGPLFRLCRARQTKILLSWGAALIATGSGVLKSQRKPGSLSAHSWATLLLLSNRVCTHWPRRTTRKSLNISYQKERSSKKRSTKESSPKKRCQTRTRRDRSSDRLVVIIPIHSLQ